MKSKKLKSTPTQNCIGNHTANYLCNGTCCPAYNKTGCCTEGETCCNGVCCPSGQVCQQDPTANPGNPICAWPKCIDGSGKICSGFETDTVCCGKDNDNAQCCIGTVCNSDGSCPGAPATCGGVNCTSEQTCVNGECVTNNCGAVNCPDGQQCVSVTSGECAFAGCITNGILCGGKGTGHACCPTSPTTGICCDYNVPCSSSGVGCATNCGSNYCLSGTVCGSDNACHTPNCVGNNLSNFCDTGETCCNGVCCPSGYSCYQNACVKNNCGSDLTSFCNSDQTCVSGVCQDNNCKGPSGSSVYCDNTHVCDETDGSCVACPGSQIACPSWPNSMQGYGHNQTNVCCDNFSCVDYLGLGPACVPSACSGIDSGICKRNDPRACCGGSNGAGYCCSEGDYCACDDGNGGLKCCAQ